MKVKYDENVIIGQGSSHPVGTEDKVAGDNSTIKADTTTTRSRSTQGPKVANKATFQII